jgi:hypothetical protein
MAQLPSQSQFGDYGEWPGRDVLDSGGERLGGVREIYLDRETGRPEWVLVDVDSGEARFVPLANASVESSTIRVAHSADAIRKAPGIGSEPRIDQSEERRLYAHYGLGYSETDSGSGLPAEVEAEEPTREQGATGPLPRPGGAETEQTSWSAAAEGPTNVAPPPADPPSVEELEAAAIPEPSADRADAGAPAVAATTEAAPSTPPAPDTPRVFTPPEPSRIHSVPPPPPEQPPGSALSLLAERKASIAAALAVALILLFMLRKLR